MYSVTFERDDGKRFLFDARNDIVFDMNLGDGLDIDVKTSQGFSLRCQSGCSPWSYHPCARFRFLH